MYEYTTEFGYTESVDYKGDRGSYLAPDECRTCYTENNLIVRNCTLHTD